MTTNDIRTKFLDFFKSKNHSIIASDSLVPKDDPTVLFTTAGMQQFKPQFLGHIDGFTRAATCQKCLRTDDLDVVGQTDFHHTFFEMLGNFSFGDYFKKDAIHWAWEFLTGELKLPKEKLWVSVYQEDTEAYGIWANEIKVPKERIVKLGDKSNFWPSNARLNGPNGPCGPCSEIFFDYGINPNCPKAHACDPDCSCGRFSEVWNLVFTQFNRKEGGVLEPLPAKNIDTGMGLERLAAVVQGKKTNYEIDLFMPIREAISSNKILVSVSGKEDLVIADHIRAIVFAIADGVIPSNKERGSVVRKLINKSANLILNRTNIKKPCLYKLAPSVIETMKKEYPELESKKEEIMTYIRKTEEAFILVCEKYAPEFRQQIEKAKNNEERGELYFEFYDTYGLPITTMIDTVENAGLRITAQDHEESFKYFTKLLEEQKKRSRAGSKMTGDVFTDAGIKLDVPKTEFLGYNDLEADGVVLKFLNESGKVKIVLNCTPFYAASGGQVGDTGYIRSSGTVIRVTDTQKINDIFIHDGILEQGNLKEGDKVKAKVDGERHLAIMRNHTATHLLQSALRETLGTHIKQQGSLVEEGRLRFDFTHPKGINPEEMKKIENRLGEFIQRSDKVLTDVLPLEEAKKKGALAFFAEKYGQTVRVVSIGDYSREFCGGTHVASTGDIEAMKIVSEGSVAQGIRRVEAVTGKKAVDDFLNKKKQESEAVGEVQRKKQEAMNNQKAYFEKLKSSLDEMIKSGENIKGANLIIRSLENIDIALLRRLSDLLKQKVKSGVFILGSKDSENASMILSVTDDLVERGIKADELMEQITPIMDGSGGGRPQLAQAGSKQPQKLDGALAQAREIVKAKL